MNQSMPQQETARKNQNYALFKARSHTSVNARVTGSGGVNLMAVASERADLATNGSGDISARVKHSLLAQTNGSGSITVYGDPAERTISGKHVHLVN